MANRDCAEIARRVIRNIRKKMRAGNYPLAKARFAPQEALLQRLRKRRMSIKRKRPRPTCGRGLFAFYYN